MSAILPLDATRIHKAHVRLINQSCSLQNMAATLTLHIVPRQGAEFIVDNRHESFERRVITLTPGQQKLRNFLCGRWIHLRVDT